mmetsp:Transcript_7127/g.27990  ORF Transcript_7127/g.27990 Transcript_7127/m.27990 type:complete len:297 (+) Transcript_7127:3995-4885(+)
MRPPYAVVARQIREQRDGLDGFSQAHLVGEDPVESLVVAAHQPVESHVLILSQRVLQQERDPTLDVRGLESVSLGLQGTRIPGEGVEDSAALARRGFLFLRHRGLVVTAEGVHAGLILVLLLVLLLDFVLLDFVLFGFFQLFGFAVAAAVRSLLHLPVPPHQLLDWNLRVCGEVVHLLLVIVVVTLGLRPSHLLFQSLLIVRIFLVVFDLEIVVVVEGLGGDWRGLPASLATLGRSRHSSGFSDDVREGRLPGLLTRRARGVHRRGFVILDLDRLFENLGSLLFLLRLLHLAIPAE